MVARRCHMLWQMTEARKIAGTRDVAVFGAQ
jgi:hypothetical protein